MIISIEKTVELFLSELGEDIGFTAYSKAFRKELQLIEVNGAHVFDLDEVRSVIQASKDPKELEEKDNSEAEKKTALKEFKTQVLQNTSFQNNINNTKP